MNEIIVHNLSNLATAALDEFNELQEDFKLYDAEKNAKLQMLIITRGFKYAFKAWKDPDGKLWIIDAHQRKRALQELEKAGFNIPQLPYELIFAKDKKEAVEEIAAYNSEFGNKNPDTKLFEKYDIDLDTLGRFSLGFETMEMSIEEQRSEMKKDLGIIIEDEVPEIQEEAQLAQLGDLWILGKHRLFCGDSTKPEHVLELMDGKRADMVTTDPPYNVDYEGKSAKTKIKNDSMSDDHFAEFLQKVFTNLFSVMKEGASIYVFHSDTEGMNFRKAFVDSGLYLAECCIWVKNKFVMGRQDYHWMHEPILYGWKPGASHNWYTDRKQSTVWEFDRPDVSGLHPTMKPVKLMAYTIGNSSREAEIVLDLFGGSGSTLMACEQTGRFCRTMELDPKFVDVIIRRFNAYSPESEIIRVRNGQREKIDKV